jgi:hypothetical protein
VLVLESALFDLLALHSGTPPKHAFLDIILPIFWGAVVLRTLILQHYRRCLVLTVGLLIFGTLVLKSALLGHIVL